MERSAYLKISLHCGKSSRERYSLDFIDTSKRGIVQSPNEISCGFVGE